MQEEQVNRILTQLNISKLNEMQLASIEAQKTRGDVVLLSPTGSGKTLAFLIPLMENLLPGAKFIQALIVVPSRELAVQIESVFKSMKSGHKVTLAYGGHDSRTERNNFTEPPAVLIGTPGRLGDHIRKETIDISKIHTIILDEFDKSLEFGFERDMQYIISQLKNLKQRVLTSATQALDVPEFTGMKEPLILNYLQDSPTKGLALKAVWAKGTDKLEALFKLICVVGHEPTLIFCNHRDTVEQLSQFFKNKRLVHDIYHGKLEQEERELAILKFRNGSNHLLITTDLASRGLDIENLKNVIHYQLPVNETSFLHRNGRTARMNAEGTAWLVLAEDDHFPEFLGETPEVVELPGELLLPINPDWTTIYISAGKKNKVNKGDIAGLLHQKGNLKQEELGMIMIGDYASFAAVKKNKAAKLLDLLRDEKIKNSKIKISIAN